MGASKTGVIIDKVNTASAIDCNPVCQEESGNIQIQKMVSPNHKKQIFLVF